MDELQTTVPVAVSAYPHKHRCPKCNGTQFELVIAGPGHLKAVCLCGYYTDVIPPDSLAGHILRRVYA